MTQEKDFPEVVRDLVGILGAKLTAYLGEVSDTRMVYEWMDGVSNPGVALRDRLRFTRNIAFMLQPYETPGTIQAWFLGRNPGLDDQSPLWLMRHQYLDTASKLVWDAAQSLITEGYQ